MNLPWYAARAGTPHRVPARAGGVQFSGVVDAAGSGAGAAAAAEVGAAGAGGLVVDVVRAGARRGQTAEGERAGDEAEGGECLDTKSHGGSLSRVDRSW